MGLDINRYSYSYGTLQKLRAWALKIEGNSRKLWCYDYGKQSDCGECIYCKLDGKTSVEERSAITKFYEFINHCDCDGGYGPIEYVNLKNYIGMWGDLKKLKEEVGELNTHKESISDAWIKKSWEDFYHDVMETDDTDILKFA